MLDFVLFDALTTRLEAGARASIDFTPAMRQIADLMRTEAVMRFEDQAGPDGRKWKPSKRALDEGGITLTKSGELKLSITSDSDATDAIAGTNKIYAGIHQRGGKITAKSGSALNTPFGPRQSVTMPAREFLGFSIADGVEIRSILYAHLDAAFNGGAAA